MRGCGMNDSERTDAVVKKEREQATNADPLYDAKAAAEYLGLAGVVKHPEQAVRALCRKRRIQSTKVAGKVMVRESWLESYITQHGREAV